MHALVISNNCTGASLMESLLRSPDISKLDYYDNHNYYRAFDPRVDFQGPHNKVSFHPEDIYDIVIDTTSLNFTDKNFCPSAKFRVGSAFNPLWTRTEINKYKFKEFAINRGVRVPKTLFIGPPPSMSEYMNTKGGVFIIKQSVSTHETFFPILFKGNPTTFKSNLFQGVVGDYSPSLFAEEYIDFDHFHHISYFMRDGSYYIFSSMVLRKSDRYVKGFSYMKEVSGVPQGLLSEAIKLLEPLAQDFQGSSLLGTLQFGVNNGAYFLLENQARLNCMNILSVPNFLNYLIRPNSYTPAMSSCLHTSKSYYAGGKVSLDLSEFPRDAYTLSAKSSFPSEIRLGVFDLNTDRFFILPRHPEYSVGIHKSILEQGFPLD